MKIDVKSIICFEEIAKKTNKVIHYYCAKVPHEVDHLEKSSRNTPSHPSLLVSEPGLTLHHTLLVDCHYLDTCRSLTQSVTISLDRKIVFFCKLRIPGHLPITNS